MTGPQHDPLDDRLSALGETGPVPALAPAGAVRARGAQRRARGRALVAGTGAAALLVAGGGAYAALSSAAPAERLDIAAAVSPSPAVPPLPVPTLAGPSPLPSPVTVPSPVASSRPSPRTSPSPRPSASPTRSAPRDLTGVVLSVADARRAEPGDWSREGFADDGPLLDPCEGGTRYPRDAARVADASTELSSSREAGGTSLLQQVAQYRTDAAARDAWEGYERAVRGCPTRASDGPPAGTTTHEVVEELSEVGGALTFYVRQESDCEGCVGSYGYYAVQLRGDLVSVLVVGVGEDGDPGRRVVEPFARVAAAQLD